MGSQTFWHTGGTEQIDDAAVGVDGFELPLHRSRTALHDL